MQNFEGVLLFKPLLTEYKVKPLLKENKLMMIKLNTLTDSIVKVTRLD